MSENKEKDWKDTAETVLKTIGTIASVGVSILVALGGGKKNGWREVSTKSREELYSLQMGQACDGAGGESLLWQP